jgi:F-type H+-transporting ATPase subunit epsilon
VASFSPGCRPGRHTGSSWKLEAGSEELNFMADESNHLRVRLVTPERILFEEAAASVELPAKNGYMEVLYGHAPLLAELGAGDVRLHGAQGEGSGGEHIYNVSWGFVEVLPDRVTILANDALRPEEINVDRANEQLDRGHKMWNEAGESEDAYDEALHVISEAEAKLATAEEKH